MTAQAPETITIEGITHSLYSQPFDTYLENLNPRPRFGIMSTGCWRGYIGKWEIKDEKLYITHIEACISHGHSLGGELVSLDYFFPNSNGEVFAEWFSGEIRIPLSGKSDYFHGGYGYTYETFMYIEISNGKCMNTKIVKEK